MDEFEHREPIRRASRKGQLLSVSMLLTASALGVGGILAVQPFLLYSGMALGGVALMLVTAREILTERCAQLDSLLERLNNDPTGTRS